VSAPVTLTAGARENVTFYTLTSAAADAPASWKLEGSHDGTAWTVIDERAGQTFAWARQTRPFKVAKPGRYAHYRLTASGSLAELELLAVPDPACARTVNGTHGGALTVGSGVTCLAAGANVTGPVVVRPGASLLAPAGATIGGSLTATGAEQVTLVGVSVGGALTATGVRRLSAEASTTGGPVTLVGNAGPVISAGTIKGPLTCAANDPPPRDNGLANTVRGPSIGQCAKL
jgi:hypothetical protein